MMVGQEEKTLCCGCGTCELVCPVNCIAMVTDPAGFVIPSIDKSACIECGKCRVVCPVLNHNNEMDFVHTSFAAYARESSVRFEGSSGGIFGLLAREILGRGGVVFGAAFDSQLQLRCVCARNEQELAPLFKSKYLQCRLDDAFDRIRVELEAGRYVLYTGTPCYVFALKQYLGRDYEKLYTVDFVCHGVPSQSLFDRCRQYVEQKEKISVLGYEFRAKKPNGATPHYYRLRYIKNGKEYITRPRLYTKSPFYLGFQKYITLRDSCYQCRFASSNRCSEMTIGDFHNVDRYIQGVNRFDGISLVTLNAEKGAELWTCIRERTKSWELDFRKLIEEKELMCGGTPKPAGREAFVADLCTKPFRQVADKHMNCGQEWKKSIYYAMPRGIRGLMKKAMGIK